MVDNSELTRDEQAPTSSKDEFTFLYLSKEEDEGVVNEVELHTDSHGDKDYEKCTVTTGRKRKRNPDVWKVKHVKKPGLRKNSPLLPLTSTMKCYKKKCLQGFSVSHLTKLRDNFQTLLYNEQNVYLNGLLHRHKTVRTTGHPRKDNPVTSSGKRIGRPPAEQSYFSFYYTILDEKGLNVRVCQKAFCCVYGFGPKRLQVLRQKLENGGLETDRRGIHGNHHTVDAEVKDLTREHIKKPLLQER